MQPLKNRLVQVCTTDGIYLHGYYAPSSDTKTILLHIMKIILFMF